MTQFESVTDSIDAKAPGIKPETMPKKTLIAPDSGAFDAIIIGGGPAGMTAGVYLERKQIHTLLISEQLGGQILWTSQIENYPGYNVISGWELANHFRDQLEKFPINLCLGDIVTNIRLTGDGGVVTTKQGREYSFKSLVVATGKKSKPLNVPGEKELFGKGVTFCATCDGPLYRGEEVTVIGGGNSALTAVNDLLALDCTVNLINVKKGYQADPVLVDKAVVSDRFRAYLSHKVEKILGDTTVTGIQINNLLTGESKVLTVHGVFIEIGLIPSSAFVRGILDMNDIGEILVNCMCETNIAGIYAAGDVTNVPEKQIIVAAGEGAKAALGVSQYLMLKR